MMVHDMVISAFSNVKTSYNYIVQLWAPVTIGGRQLLSTYRQPFAVRYLYTKSENHRLRCEKYGYNVNVNNESIVDDNEHNCWPEIKSSGPPLSAFLNGLPEISSSVHQEAGPLLGDGYEESELMGSLFLIPIFNPSGSSSSSDCIGVVECLMDVTDIFSFLEMNRALERVVSHQEVLFYPHKPEVIVSWVEKRQSYSQIIVCSDDDKEHNCWLEIKSSGPPLSAFLNGFPEILSSVLHEAGPLLGDGYEESELMGSLLIPIFNPSGSSSSSDCIGVVECLMDVTDIFSFLEMNRALEETGLRVFNVQDRIPYKAISGLKRTRDEIQKALETVCESHHIIAQVWISYEDDTLMKRKLALKLTGYISSDDQFPSSFSPHKKYYDACDMIPLTMRGELVLKTFQDCEPRFCEASSGLDTAILLSWIDTDECSCLTICMRSIDTSDVGYAFEFIWYQNPKHVIFLEGLLITLKRCLPCFKFATGAELGDELHVIDVDNSTESETKRFKIFQENRLLPTPEAMEKGNTAMVVDHRANTEVKCKTAKIPLSLEAIEQQFGKTMKEAATNLNVSVSTLKRNLKVYGIIEWPGPGSRKRKLNDSFNNQNSANEKNYGAIQDPLSINRDENTITIKAEYAGNMIKFDLPISEATFDTVKKEIFMRFDLTVGTYNLKYHDEVGDLISLLSDKDMGYYMESLKKLNQKEVRLYVCPRLALGAGGVDRPRAS
ncbi:NIN-like protein [Tanacetum coccineum]